MANVNDRLKTMKQRLDRVTGPPSFKNAFSEVNTTRAWYRRTKKEMPSATAKRVKQQLANATRRLQSMGDLNTLPTVPRSLMNRVRRKPVQTNASTYAGQVSSYLDNIDKFLDGLRHFKSFQMDARMHPNGVTSNDLRSLRWEGDLAMRNRAGVVRSVRVLVVPAVEATKSYSEADRMLNGIKPYIAKVRSIDAAAATRLDRRWQEVKQKKEEGQRLVNRWRSVPKAKQQKILSVYRAFRAKLNRGTRDAEIKRRSFDVSHKNYYGFDEVRPRNTATRRTGGLERFMFRRPGFA